MPGRTSRPRRWSRPVGLVALALAAGSATGAAPSNWISFPTAPEAGAPRASGHTVRAFLATPDGATRAPGVVLLHGCRGPRAFHKAWARALAERGFVAVLPDSHLSRHRPRACAGEDAAARAERIRDALGALHHLAWRPRVDRRRLAILGWDDAPVGELLTRSGPAAEFPPALGAAVAIGPRCASRSGPGEVALLVIGSADGCETLTSDIERVFRDAPPGFDDPDARGGSGARRYDASTHAGAIDAVARFLGERLGAGTGPDAPWTRETPPPVTVPAGARWLLAPEAPGPDLPPVGASLFDELFSEPGPGGWRYRVPYPFEALLGRLRAAYPEPLAAAPAWSTALIPYGRSLQRHAAAPDYAESPRVVVAATGDAGAGASVDARDRLFVAFQPRAGVLEVISYNEQAGRFEFQVVTGYAPGAQPEVRYARRALCVSCHQNQAPIFPEAAWDETNSNPRVVRRLASLGTHFEGVPTNGMGPSAAAIDNATDRASLLAAMQPLWREGCAGEDGRAAARCRAGALLAMIQYRLSAAAGYDAGQPLAAAFVSRLEERWDTLWPDGALVPDADIPNRDPLLSPEPATVDGPLDPLRPRPPAAIWPRAAGPAAEGLVAHLGGALPADDLARIDARLAALAGSGAQATHERGARCAFVRRGVAGRPARVEVSCAGDGREGFALEASFTEARVRAGDGAVTWLDIGGTRFTNVTARGTVRQRAGGATRSTLALARARSPERLRLTDGTAVRAIVFDRILAGPRGRVDGAARLVLVDDFAPLVAALERMATDARPDGPLGDGPFRARQLTGAVLEALGARRDPGRCCAARGAPAPRVAEQSSPGLLAALEHGGPLRTFARYCGSCHAAAGSSPPGFLAGGPLEIRTGLEQCAPRILHRLEAWRLAPEARDRMPMPPPAGLRLAGVSATQWTTGDDLAALRAYVARGLAEAGLDPGSVLARPYHQQPSCTPG